MAHNPPGLVATCELHIGGLPPLDILVVASSCVVSDVAKDSQRVVVARPAFLRSEGPAGY